MTSDYYMGFEPQEEMQQYELGKWNAILRAMAIGQELVVNTEADRNAILTVAPRIGVAVCTMKMTKGGYAIRRVIGMVRKVGRPRRAA